MSDSSSHEQEWRWPAHIAMSPTSLKTFSQCHSRVKMQYLQDLQPPEKWVRFFALGNATHSLLGTIAQQLKVGASHLTDDNMRLIARSHMPAHEYPTEEAREADIQLVINYVHRGRGWLESIPVEEWLLIERSQRREVPLFPARTHYKLLTKPDLIIKQLDEEGEPYFHAIDWKTGSVREEHDVPVITRYVVRELLQQWSGDASAARMVFTWYWLEENYRHDVDLTIEYCNHLWPGIVNQMEALATESVWKATPGWWCHYCPFYGNYCPEEIPPELD